MNYKYDNFDLRLKLTHKNSPAPALWDAGAGFKNEISNERFPTVRKLRICGLWDVKTIQTKIHHSAFKIWAPVS